TLPSHYDPWLVQHIDRLRRILGIDNSENAIQHIGVGINALNCRGSNEVFGICPLPDAEASKLGIARGDVEMVEAGNDKTIQKLKDTVYLRIGSTLRPLKARYHYVAKKQGCKYAVLAIHKSQEMFLFKMLLSELSSCDNKNRAATSRRTTLDFEAFAAEWNMFANGDFIFYETPEHLEQYYNQWKEQEAARKTHIMHVGVIESMEVAIEQNRQEQIAHFGAVSPTIPSIALNTNDISLSDSSLLLPSSSLVLTVSNEGLEQQQQHLQQQHPQHLQQQQQYQPAVMYAPIERLRNINAPQRYITPQPSQLATVNIITR
ncbi:hypothetical protein MBANPS3_012535, partial [Mucor bainieri]